MINAHQWRFTVPHCTTALGMVTLHAQGVYSDSNTAVFMSSLVTKAELWVGKECVSTLHRDTPSMVQHNGLSYCCTMSIPLQFFAEHSCLAVQHRLQNAEVYIDLHFDSVPYEHGFFLELNEEPNGSSDTVTSAHGATFKYEGGRLIAN